GRFHSRAAVPAIEVKCDRNLPEPIPGHNGVSLLRRKRAKTQMIDGAQRFFRAAIPRRNENRSPVRSEGLIHSRLPLRDVGQLFSVCAAGAELAFPALALVILMEPAVLIQFDQLRRGPNGFS